MTHDPQPMTHYILLSQLVTRDIAGRYRGSIIGIGWSLLMPLLMLGVYTFVFGVVFKARWQGLHTAAESDLTAFALMLFTGLIAHGAIAEGLARGPALILQHANFVKKVVFPLELLPPMATLSIFFHTGISLFILLLAVLSSQGTLPVTALLIPVILLPFFLLVLGVVYALSALGVYARDIGQLTQLLSALLLFMGPVFYPVSAVPEFLQPLFWLNPLTPVVEQLRQIILLGITPNWHLWLLSLLFSSCILGLGYLFFRLTRKGFADVL